MLIKTIDLLHNSTSDEACVVAPVQGSSRTLSTLRFSVPQAPSILLPEANSAVSLIKFSFLLILISCIFSNAVKAEPTKLVIAGDYWCPYNCMPDSDYQGFLVEILQKSLHIYGIEVDYKMMPWHEALIQIKEGKIDGIIGISSILGKNLITTKIPLEYSITGTFIRNDNNWTYDDLPSLMGKKIGMVMDYTFDEDINNFIGMNYTKKPGLFIIEDGKNAVIDCVTKLMDGNIDVYIEDIRVVEYYINEHNLSANIKNAGKVSSEKLPLYVAFNAQTPNIEKYINFLEEGFGSLKATGEYDDLRKKYKMDMHKQEF